MGRGQYILLALFFLHKMKGEYMATGIGAYVIETDGSIHKMIFAGDGEWEDAEIGNVLTDIFSKGELPMLKGDK